ncbi:MAG: hypothetical protein R2991_06550 [Thermoanaerobaculia bacterium]
MLRDVGAAVAGLALFFVVRWLGLSLAWKAWGVGFAFEPGTTTVSTPWILLSLGLALAGAFLGGWVAGSMRGGRAVQLLAGALLLLGVVGVVAGARREHLDAPEDLGTLTSGEVLVVARAPGWMAVLEPLLATAGALVGGTGRRRR